jgi:thiamine biosynthesis lipoprotein
VTDRLAARFRRRRVLSLLAAAGRLALAMACRVAGAGPRDYEWRAAPRRAAARLLLVHVTRRSRGESSASLDEVARLEGIFSLHRPDSELVRLNAAGRLRAPSHDLRIVLAEARRFAVLTDGAFDPSVQPLWRLYADHFARHPGDPAGPDPRRIEAARAFVDYRGIEVEGGLVALRRPGMAVTLNGIAQGYIADRVADLLRESGFDRVR